MPRRWSDVFTLISQRKAGHCGAKTTPADELTWEGTFRRAAYLRRLDGAPVVRQYEAHFLTHSGARIGSHSNGTLLEAISLTMVVHARRPLAADQLLSLGQLAMTEDTHPIFVRRKGETLKYSLSVPPPS